MARLSGWFGWRNGTAPATRPGQMAIEGDIHKVVLEELFPPRRRLPWQSAGTMIEVGAARPDYLSIGGGLRPYGWRVIGIEPNPEFCALHRSLGNEIIECACGDEDRDDVSFCLVDSKGSQYLGGEVTGESFSSLGIRGPFADLIKTVTVETRDIKVRVRRLDTIISQHRPRIRQVDVVCVDVEGWELEVMSGMNLDLYRPKVLIIENVFEEQRYTDFFAARGYVLWRRLNPNDIYVRQDSG